MDTLDELNKKLDKLLKERKKILRELNGRRQRRETFSHLIARLHIIDIEIDELLDKETPPEKSNKDQF